MDLLDRPEGPAATQSNHLIIGIPTTERMRFQGQAPVIFCAGL
jgi:hypothetical protein